MNKHRQAFSLIELSIVLVIIALLAGGILTGQSLIRAAEIRSLVSTATNYETAIKTFRSKYRSIPGDMVDAADYWGSAGGSGMIGDGCENGAISGTNTCGGNGDRIIAYTSTSYPVNGVTASVNDYWERFTAWQHLANAGLIDGSFTGKTQSQKHIATINVNVPDGKVDGAGWDIFHRGTFGSGDSVFLRTTVEMGNLLFVGTSESGTEMIAPAFTTEEAYSVDTKLDDGLLNSGQLLGINWSSCSTATAGNSPNPQYDLENKEIACSLAFRGLF